MLKVVVYARVEADGNVKSSVDKFYSQEVLQEMKNAFGAKPGDLIFDPFRRRCDEDS